MVTNGAPRIESNSANARGGGVCVTDNASVALYGDAEIDHNSAQMGGGVFVQHSASIAVAAAAGSDAAAQTKGMLGRVGFRSKSDWCNVSTPDEMRRTTRSAKGNVTECNRALLVGDELLIDGCCGRHVGWIRGGDYSCRPCGMGLFESPPYPTTNGTKEQCSKCAPGLVCMQCTPQSILDQVYCIAGAGVAVQPGWWRPPGAPSDLWPSRCPNMNCLNTNGSTGARCAAGSTGVLCGECTPGRVLLPSGECENCPESTAMLVAALVGLVILVLLSIAALVSVSMPERIQGKFVALSLVKLYTLYTQVLGQLPQQRSDGKRIDWGPLAT
eukprot:gene19651-biopygen26066